ncbi:hypothetical protein AGMMS49574_01120 [Bacteroidia bacterium]|nr:hypothetical protein AGMMS49574_01120 [Bacteroidia bacterium]
MEINKSNQALNPQNEGSNSNHSRRAFLRKATAATFSLAGTSIFYPATAGASTPSAMATPEAEAAGDTPWFRKTTRWGQTNITEKDPLTYDIGWWRNQWKKTQVQGVIINAGGIVAYYPTKIPLHYQARFLQGRDLFGDLCRAAHEDGLIVFARMDSNRANADFYKAHPDWFAIDGKGKPYRAEDLYITCINSPYYREYLPSILTEISDLYKPEGFTDNSWSGLGRNSICYCENCRKSFRARTGKELPKTKNWDDPVYRQWIRWSYDMRLEIWDLNNRTTKAAGGPNCTWSGMNSGSISNQASTFRDFKAICERADIIMLDHQSRSDASGFQNLSDSGKQIHSVLGWDKLIPDSMAMYQAGRPTFRISSKPVSEAHMWMIEGFAGGIQPWWHHIAAYHEDRRMYHTAEPIFKWYKANEEYLINREPVGSVGVVWSQENTDYYGRDDAEQRVNLPWRGITQALIRARIPYIPVHADHIDKQFARYNLPDHGNLLANVIRWATKDESPVSVSGPGLIDCNIYTQPGKMIIHLVNLTSAATWRAPLDEYIPVGPITVKVKLPENVKGDFPNLLVTGQRIVAETEGGWSKFQISSILNHEVVVLS